MTKEKWKVLLKRVKASLLMIIILIASITPIRVEAAGIQNVEEIDFSDFSNWRSGVYYYANGKYTEDSYRICLNDYVTFTSDKFKAHITDSAFRILIRELNSNKNLLRSVTLQNGQEYEPGDNAVYLAISIYKFANGEKDMSYEVFETKFTNGFIAELCAVKDTSSNTTSGSVTVPDVEVDLEEKSEEQVTWESVVEKIDFTDFSNWRTGHYDWTTGKYASYSSRICLNDYVTFENDEYQVSINKSGYQMLIREMDANMKFLKTYNLANGETYEPGSSAAYLGISLYKLSESGVTYSTFKNLFANGFEAELMPVEKIVDDSIIAEAPSISTEGSANSSMGTTTKKATFYDCLKESLENGDTSEVDVSSYKVTNIEFYNTIWPQIKEDCYVEYHSCRNVYPEITVKNGYVVSYKLINVDAEYKERIKRVRTSVNEFIKSVDSRMSDLEKVLLAHEYIVNNTEYKLDEAICYTAGGPLGNGYGVCLGYAEAMMLLLHELNIENTLARSPQMDHAWVYVKVDGYWYHVDPTWADTKRNAYGQYMHKFLIRNDKEYETIAADKVHYDWTCINVNESSVSAKYTDWYVHDVAGSMYYYNGMWYYWDIDTNSILRSNIEGTVTNVIVDGSDANRIILNGISGNVLSYSIGTTQYFKTL